MNLPRLGQESQQRARCREGYSPREITRRSTLVRWLAPLKRCAVAAAHTPSPRNSKSSSRRIVTRCRRRDGISALRLRSLRDRDGFADSYAASCERPRGSNSTTPRTSADAVPAGRGGFDAAEPPAWIAARAARSSGVLGELACLAVALMPPHRHHRLAGVSCQSDGPSSSPARSPTAAIHDRETQVVHPPHRSQLHRECWGCMDRRRP